MCMQDCDLQEPEMVDKPLCSGNLPEVTDAE